MAERNKLASIPGQPLPERKSNFLSDLWDEASGAFARYGRRSGAQRDASLALLNQAVDPNTDPLSGAAQKVLGLAGLVTHPLAFFPTREEWDQRLQAAGNDSRVGRSIGGFLSDLPSLIDPQMAAGGAVLATAPLASKMLNKADDVADAGIIAYHGSPHSFDKFDMSKIGTGEGAQAYGHGLYFAEEEEVARGYRDALLKKSNEISIQGAGDLSEKARALIVSAARKPLNIGGLADAEVARMMKDDIANIAATFPIDKGAVDEALSAIDGGARPSVSGHMYQVKINVKPDELLDWDKPLSEHPEPVRNALMSLMDGEKAAKIQAGKTRLDTGADAYRAIPRVNYAVNKNGQFEASAAKTKQEALAEAGGDASKVREIRTQDAGHATEILKQNGIKGIRYKDAGSRGTEGGTYNYVIFDDKLITILKKYGIPMTAGAGGAMMVAGQDMPPEFAAQMGGA